MVLFGLDPASVALGGAIGTLFWLYALIKYFPRKFREAEERINDKIVEKEQQYKNEIETIMSGDNKQFNTIIDEKIPAMMDNGIKKLLLKLATEPTEEMQMALHSVAMGGYYTLMNDPEIKRSIQGEINGRINGVMHQIENRLKISEEDLKDLHEIIQWLKEMKAKYAPRDGGGDPNDMMGMFVNMMGGMGGGGGPPGFPM